MVPSVSPSTVSRHRELPDMRPSAAKAHLRKTESPSFRVAIGAAIQRATSLLGWSLKELAGAVERDPRQVARWLDGSERAQLDALWAVEEMRQPLVVAFAELAQVEVETVIRIRSKLT